MSGTENQNPDGGIADAEFDNKYEIKRCANWINMNCYKKICLQFPDELLDDAIHVKNQLQVLIDADLYVSADATFRSCCLDLKTAKHVNADALIHFGRICSSRFHSKSTASLFVLPKEYLNIDALADCLTSLINEKECNVVLLYDIAFAHYADQFDDRFSAIRPYLNLSQLLAAENGASDATNFQECSLMKDTIIVKKFGRQYSVDFPNSDRMLVYVYVISPSGRKNFENFLLSSPESTFYTYDSRSNELSAEHIPKTIKKTLFRVEKVKQAQRIGIVVATLEAHLFLDAVGRIKKLCALKKKKTYIISVGKLNVAKLANFPEIDLFVMISCPEIELVDRKDYFQTIVSPMELELALNDNHQWMGKFVADFREFLPGGNEYKPIDENVSKSQHTDISLLNNRLIGFDQGVDGCDRDTSTVTVVQSYNPSASALSAVDNSQYSLANRSWTGLQTNNDQDIPVSAATVGRKGAPAAGYQTPFTDHVT